jgi:hypothetical protein
MNGSGGLAQGVAAGPARPAQVFRLEIVRVGRDGRRRSRVTDIPVAIREAPGSGDGPYFLQRLAKGRYALTSHYDAWSFMSPVTIDKARRRVVLEDKS